MNYTNSITSMHLDVLREIGNIGAGHAATALSKLLNRKVDMKVPDVRIVSFDEMMELAGGDENIVVSVFLRIEGDAPGNMFFLLPTEQAAAFVHQLTGDDTITFDEPPYSEMGLSAMQEVGNILSGSYLSSLANFTNLTLAPSVPALSIDMAGAIVSYGLIELSQKSDYAIVIDTSFKDAESGFDFGFNGHFFLLPDPDSFETIFRSLGVPQNG
ncbi:chemotaxis protein CheC [Falsibacillus pallidus]|uniref:Chemotaxis protein CheC n=1 Tax=Falsibacillus pallidus TaxID=493781 RepID=A0A370GUR1_9BACI|nr:chemotaxis protein CheC [Falsibacillus pallidus]RDI47435.1 chemotaxis protein CheC [Falsibacillus pallidus]